MIPVPPVRLWLVVISENRVFSLASVGLKLDFPALSSDLGVDSITNNAFLIARESSKEKSEQHFHFFLNKYCEFPPGEVAQL